MQWKADFCSLTQQLFVRSEGRSPLHLMLSFDLVGGCKPSETISTGVKKPPGCQCNWTALVQLSIYLGTLAEDLGSFPLG